MKGLRVVHRGWNQPKKLKWSGQGKALWGSVIEASRCDQLNIVVGSPLSAKDTYQDPLWHNTEP